VARTLEPGFLREMIESSRMASRKSPPMRSLGGAPGFEAATASTPGSIRLVPDALPALRHSRAAIVASGTATVEAALMETPFVMVYRVSPLTYTLGKPRVKVTYYAMVNLIADEEVVPELVQQKFTAANIVAELAKIIPDGAARETMIRGLRSVREKLKRGGGTCHTADRAAEIIIKILKS